MGSVIVALLVGLSACAMRSVLVTDQDPTFLESQQALRRTEQIVDDLRPEPSDRSAFMQAESFYRYLFTPPPRGTTTYLAEFAAAATDFPGFQALAGSLELVDLRYRSPDAAVQLWESLLARNPQTTLKPLTLYRLGWAYRNVGAQGLPRSSETVFDELIREQPDSPLATLAGEAKDVPWKSKDSAAIRSVIPGLG